MTAAILPGQSHPLGASVTAEGVNFAIWSRTAVVMDLLLFDHVDDAEPSRVIRLDPLEHRTYSYWHAFVPGLTSGQLYAWRAHGVYDPPRGLRHDPGAVLLDPYGKAVAVPADYDRYHARRRKRDASTSIKSVVVDLTAYDWEGDRPLNREFTRTVIYELHVKGFTAHPNSGIAPELRGTYAGLIEKIPYLKDLGITAVELMPVQAFDPQDAPPGRVNYWGYSPVSFFAVHPAYSSSPDPVGALDEFRTMVKELHKAGIEVILDVVYNHTAEGSTDGPTFCWRGLDDDAYYLFEGDDCLRYANYSGCGNTLNANHAIVRRMILDSLHHWVADMHVDGFRFDLASILSRDSQGRPMSSPPVLWQIETDPVLAGTKLIAEAWDAGGLYQVGSFVGDRWREWNGRFRDDLRDFARGDRGSVARLPNRFLASPDLYGRRRTEVDHSINFITAHDGFTLNDLVTYSHKHNLDNGENNRDGSDWERSWNHGVEGPSSDPQVERVRLRVIKSFLAIMLVSVGCPMISMGDEVRRTQHGNNNPYCQDNETSWFDWSLVDINAELLTFVRAVIAVRMGLDLTTVRHGLSLREFVDRLQVEFHGVHLYRPDWSDDSHSLAMTLRGIGGSRLAHVILNAWDQPLEFQLPVVDRGHPWRRIIDTALAPPDDVGILDHGPEVHRRTYLVAPHSMVYLVSTLPRPALPPATLATLGTLGSVGSPGAAALDVIHP